MEFLGSLETLERFTKINQVSLATNETFSNPILTAAFNFTIYVFTGNDPGELQ